MYHGEEMEEMETEMLKDHEAIDALLKERGREHAPDGKKMPEMPEVRGGEKMAAVIWKIAFPLVSTALATVVRAVIERAIGG